MTTNLYNRDNFLAVEPSRFEMKRGCMTSRNRVSLTDTQASKLDTGVGAVVLSGRVDSVLSDYCELWGVQGW